jgi:hypothetical protein
MVKVGKTRIEVEVPEEYQGKGFFILLDDGENVKVETNIPPEALWEIMDGLYKQTQDGEGLYPDQQELDFDVVQTSDGQTLH